MSATLIFTESIVGPYTATPVGAGDLNISWTAADPVNGNYYVYDAPDGDILLAWNTDYGVAHNFTLSSTTDSPFLRLGDITYSLTAGQIMAYNLGEFPSNVPTGWATQLGSTFNIQFLADSATVMFAIIQR